MIAKCSSLTKNTSRNLTKLKLSYTLPSWKDHPQAQFEPTPSGIVALSAAQLVGLVYTLFSTPTLQDTLTVQPDLQRTLQSFEDFPNHITEHMNHHESLQSFNQPCANISKILQAFRDSIQRWPHFDSVIASWEEQHSNVLTRDFSGFTTYLLTRR